MSKNDKTVSLGQYLDEIQSKLPLATEKDIEMFDFQKHPVEIKFSNQSTKIRRIILVDKPDDNMWVPTPCPKSETIIGWGFTDEEAFVAINRIFAQYKSRRNQAKGEWAHFILKNEAPTDNFLYCLMASSWIARSAHWFSRMGLKPVYVMELAYDGYRYYTRQNNQNSYRINLRKENSDTVVSLYSFIQKRGIVIETTNLQTKARKVEVASTIIDMKNKIKKIYSELSIEDQNVFDDI